MGPTGVCLDPTGKKKKDPSLLRWESREEGGPVPGKYLQVIVRILLVAHLNEFRECQFIFTEGGVKPQSLWGQ